jgi:hypothetical protein
MNSITLGSLKRTLLTSFNFLMNEKKKEMPIILTLDEVSFILDMINEVRI